MGYTTQFYGQVTIEPPLSEEEAKTYTAFAQSRHDEVGFPGYYCQWELYDNETIQWDSMEKFYGGGEWMVYIIDNFFKADHVCNGVIEAYGEESDDIWRIVVEDNVVKIQEGTVTYR